MAFFQTEEENKNKEQSATGEQVLGAESSQVAPSAAPGGQAPKKGTGFTNLISYVNANKGNDAEMGNAIKGNVDSQIQNTNNQATTFKDNTQKVINDNTVKDNNIISALKSNPVNVKKDDFQKQYNASWNAFNNANEAEGYQDVASKYNNLQQKADLSNEYEGRKELLKDAYGRPTYTQGEQRLDSFILGAGQGGVNALNEIKQNVGTAKTGWDGLLGAVNQNIASAKATTDKTRQDTRSAYDNVVKGVESEFDSLQKSLEAEKANQAKTWQTLQNNLNSNDPKAREAAYKALGLDADSGEFLKANDFALTRLAEQAKARSLGDAADANDLAKYEALNALTDSTSKYDFSKAGGSKDAFKAKAEYINAAKQANAIDDALQARWEQQQQQRLDDYAFTKAALSGQLADPSSIYAQLGITAEDMDLAKGGERGNHNYQAVDPLAFLKQGKALTKGDIAKAEEITQWGNLMKALGVNKSIEGAANAGNAYEFDKDAFLAAINAGKTVDAQTTTSGDVIHGINKGIRDGSYTTNQEVQRAPDNIGAAGTNVAQVLSGKKKLF